MANQPDDALDSAGVHAFQAFFRAHRGRQKALLRRIVDEYGARPFVPDASMDAMSLATLVRRGILGVEHRREGTCLRLQPDVLLELALNQPNQPAKPRRVHHSTFNLR